MYRAAFPVLDKTLVNPMNAIALTDGEWLTLSNTAPGKLERATPIGTIGACAKQLAFPLWNERGSTDIQAIAGNKATIIFRGQFEFDTRIYDPTALTASISAMMNILQPVKVATIQATVAGAGVRNFSGLVGSSYDDPDPIVGYITRLPPNNGGKLRFIQGWAVRNGCP